MDCQDCVYIKNLTEKQEEIKTQVHNFKNDVYDKLDRGNKRFENAEKTDIKLENKIDTIITEQKSIKSVLLKFVWGFVGSFGSIATAVTIAYLSKIVVKLIK